LKGNNRRKACRLYLSVRLRLKNADLLIPASNIEPDQETKGKDGEGGIGKRDIGEGGFERILFA
jgi:hypothetical protein